MVNLKQLIEALQALSDPEFQRRAWLASEGRVVSSFSEDVSQAFDDTGLTLALDADKCPDCLDEQVFSILRELSTVVKLVDQSEPPERLLKDPQLKKVRELSARALTLLREG